MIPIWLLTTWHYASLASALGVLLLLGWNSWNTHQGNDN